MIPPNNMDSKNKRRSDESDCQRTKTFKEQDQSNSKSSEDENDDEYCIYMYKGDSQNAENGIADLPLSFFKFHASETLPGTSAGASYSNGFNHGSPTSSVSCYNRPQLLDGNINNYSNNIARNNANRIENEGIPNIPNETFSPEMDFLEMDFDPGTTGDENSNSCDDTDSDTPNGSNLDGTQNSGDRKQNASSVCKPNIDENTPEVNSTRKLSSAYLSQERVPGTSRSFHSAYNVSYTKSSIDPLPNGSSGTRGSQENGNTCKKSLNYDNNDWAHTVNIYSGSSNCQVCQAAEREENASKPSPHVLAKELGHIKVDECLFKGGAGLKISKSVTHPELSVSIRETNKVNEGRNGLTVSISTPLFKSSDLEPEENLNEMIWTLEQASKLSYSQIGRSACGATAILNVMAALNLPSVSPEVANDCVGTRTRDEDAELPEYLFSRSSAGCTHEDIIRAMNILTDGKVLGKFFQPPRNTTTYQLYQWLSFWISKGAVPVATMNLQAARSKDSTNIPDSWHHQMICGVSTTQVLALNPLAWIDLGILLPQLSSPSVLLVRRKDILDRMRPATDLRRLIKTSDIRWVEMNVLGQVSNIFLEEVPPNEGVVYVRRCQSTHVSIPASYKAGVTLFVLKDSVGESLLKDYRWESFDCP